ncbi:hypothetical protein PS662_01969 [Pseudomonas fluorescens]|uniref:Fibronectin type-III domain-containing protein n=1 Tax=Pseudomonas fluorescens TaxID=294 RepID=A0A5E6S6I5_PSEFL|nr:fibronectin type III domain-containing protein [Pseudomonas fluorescens]VVM74273.1 hypothetical protein PS662_01969 [Pseudomonas fluorescens]
MTNYNSNDNAVRPGMPEDFIVNNINNNSALAKWKLPTDSNAYRSFIGLSGASEQEVVGEQWQIENLLPDTQYLIRLQIENQLGQRSRPEYVPFNTSVEPLTSPSGLRVLQDDTGSVTLGWEASTGGVEPINSEVSDGGGIYATTGQLTQVVDNLAPGTKYEFSVACFDITGTFSQSISIQHTTPSSLKLRGVILSPEHDPHEYEDHEAAPRTAFPGAKVQFVVEGGIPPYKIDLLGSTAATVDGLVVTLLRKAGIALKIEDSRGAEVPYLINPLYWFSTPSNATFTHRQAQAGGTLPDVHIMSNRGGPGDRQVGTLCSEWGDLTKQGWPKKDDDTVYYWTVNASSEPPLGKTYEAVGVANNMWGGRLETRAYFTTYVS